tara:strand:- start:1472 stop:3817 length:2346 start_codon:yes stop_codon:yes gene_type:complete
MSSVPGQVNIGQVTGSGGASNLVGVFNGAITIGGKDDSKRTFSVFNRIEHKHNARWSAENLNACRGALFLTDPYTDREILISMKGMRVTGTCQWITSHESYQSWLEGRTHLLWISGGPGKGKTMMSIFLTQELEKTVSAAKSSHLVFYFCSHGDEKRNTPLAILRSLIYQIISQTPSLADHVHPYLGTPEQIIQTVSSLETLWIIFSKIVDDAKFPPTICVIDGLDECDEQLRRNMVPRMIHLLSETSDSKAFRKFKLAVLSREIQDLRGCTQIRLDPDNNKKVKDDMEQYVSARVKELKRIEGFTKEVQRHVEQTLLLSTQGTFLWVGFAMHELLQKTTCTEVLETLTKIHRGIFAVYSRLLLQIPEERRETSRQILQWVSTALRPLCLAELASAVDVEATSGLMTIEQAILDEIAFCGPFLKIEGKIVELVHQSAQDYLLREKTDSDPILETFRIKPESAHMYLARTCLDRFVRQGMNDISSHRSSGVFSEVDPLLEYARDQVPNHVQKCPTFVSQLSGTIIRIAAFDLEVRNHWFGYHNSVWVTMPALHIACCMGSLPLAQTLLKRTIRNPLIRWRLEKRAGNLKFTPLHIAVRHNQTAVVKFLVDRGANVNTQDLRGQTALHEAVMQKNEELVRLLLDCGANPDVKDKSGQTALYMSISPWKYNEDIVRLLLQHTTNLNIRTNISENALHHAILRNNEAAARLLLNYGVDLEAKNIWGSTPLHLAASYGHQTIVQLLLKSGANPATKDNRGTTALDLATSRRHTNVIPILKKALIEG